MRIGAIIQARMGSRRLPGKVLRQVAGKPVLGYLLERLAHCRAVDAVVVATSREAEDAPLAEFCREWGVACHRGALDDVAGRFKEVLDLYPFDGFVRLSGDSPLLDQRLVDTGVQLFREGHAELVTNISLRTYPQGQSVEVLRADTFRRGYARLREQEDREHATQFFYKHGADFAILNFAAERDYSHLHLSVDTAHDLERFAAVVARLDRPHWQYGWRELVQLHEEVGAPAIAEAI